MSEMDGVSSCSGSLIRRRSYRYVAVEFPQLVLSLDSSSHQLLTIDCSFTMLITYARQCSHSKVVNIFVF